MCTIHTIVQSVNYTKQYQINKINEENDWKSRITTTTMKKQKCIRILLTQTYICKMKYKKRKKKKKSVEKYYEIESENVLLLLNWSVILCYYLSHFRCLFKIGKPKTKIIKKLLENCISRTITSTELENLTHTKRKTDKQIMNQSFISEHHS